MANEDDDTSSSGPERLLAFSDGVFAIIITIMVLELKAPHTAEPAALIEQWPTFLAYALSYLQAGIYWVNHHALFKTTQRVDARVLWHNLVLLFALSLVPFATAYAGETQFAKFPTAVYALVMLLPALTWNPLHAAIARINPGESDVTRTAMRRGMFALGLYVAAVPLAFVHPAISLVLILAVAAMYALPARYF
jgi:uncharacterized membrane protein